MAAQMRMLRLADGPNEVHRMQVAKRELDPYRQAAKAAPERATV
jgi:acyl-CoA dehydrogenase